MMKRLAVIMAVLVGLALAVWLYQGAVKSRFFDAVCARDLVRARRWIDMWPGLVSATDGRKEAAIHWAVDRCDVKMVAMLIKHGADVNQPAPYLGLPLDLAASQCDSEIVQLLLDAGAAVEGRSPYPTGAGATALHSASVTRLANIQLLLEHGADPNARKRNGSTPLFDVVASAGGVDDDQRIEAAKVLLEAGADVNAKNNSGDSALSLLEQLNDKGQRERLRQFLLSHGAVR